MQCQDLLGQTCMEFLQQEDLIEIYQLYNFVHLISSKLWPESTNIINYVGLYIPFDIGRGPPDLSEILLLRGPPPNPPGPPGP